MPEVSDLKVKLDNLANAVNDAKGVYDSLEYILSTMEKRKKDYENAMDEKRVEFNKMVDQIRNDRAGFEADVSNKIRKSESNLLESEKILETAKTKDADIQKNLDAAALKLNALNEREVELKAREDEIASKIEQFNKIKQSLS